MDVIWFPKVCRKIIIQEQEYGLCIYSNLSESNFWGMGSITGFSSRREVGDGTVDGVFRPDLPIPLGGGPMRRETVHGISYFACAADAT